ncbi:MAG: sn-glycerol-1-phosphate dehydrogenase [Faecalibacterium sp.]|nr:sn-glycerol-1-phosphate dehydrogenase [Faecalibacterium sp.]
MFQFEFDCTCEQKKHRVPLKAVEISEGAAEKVADILKGYHKIFLVADENTYQAAGRRVEQLLRQAGMLSHSFVLAAGAHPTDTNVGRVLIEAGLDREKFDINKFSQLPDYILAVGSGSVNDICRMVSYRLGLEYGVVGTAPSMDGYVSMVAPLIVGNKKMNYDCTTARHVIIDLNICAQAPYELLQAGVGDMVCKYVALLDWRLARRTVNEYYCDTVVDMVFRATDTCVKNAYHLHERSIEAVRSTIEGLILSGLCMAYTGSSRPASGCEHMVGQTWETMDVEEGKLPNSHGIECGEAAFMAMAMYRRLYRETDDQELKAMIGEFLPLFDEVRAMQQVVRMPFTVTEKQRFVEGVLRGRTFRRNRYTILQYLYDRGLLEEYAASAYDEIMQMDYCG